MPGAAACQYHPEREAIGVCVECRKRVCGDCVTKVEGINHCAACLAKLAAEGVRGSLDARRVPSGIGARVSAAAYFVVLSVAVWFMLQTLLPGGG